MTDSKKIEDGGPAFPKDGSWFTTETVVHTTYRWKPYKPQAVRQLGRKGRWQKMVWHGDFFKWENCDDPDGLLVPEERSAARKSGGEA